MKKNLMSAKIWVAPILVYLFFLLITCGAASLETTQKGSFLSGLLVSLAGSHDLVAHLLAGTALFAAYLGMLLLAKDQNGTPVWLASLLALTIPAAVYSQTYGSLNGALSVAPAAALTLFYLVLAEKVLGAKHKKARYALPLFVLGVAAQFFHVSLSIGICILSFAMTVKYWKRGSWVLLLHSLSAWAGCVVALLFSEKIPWVSTTNLLCRAEALVDGILAKNWPMLLLLTTACLLLIQPLRADRSKRCSQILQELLLPVAVFALCPYLKPVALIAAALKLLFAVVYLRGLWQTVKIYVNREHRRHQIQRLLAASGAFVLPLLLVGERNDGLFYLPCLLMAAATLLLWSYALHHFGNLERFCRKLMPAVGITVLCCCVWIAVCNNMTDGVRREYSRHQESAGATEICLPEYPFAEYRAEEAVDFTTLTVEFCPWEEWDWSGYYANLRSSDSDEGTDEEKTNNMPSFKDEEE